VVGRIAPLRLCDSGETQWFPRLKCGGEQRANGDDWLGHNDRRRV
jgi:hypothetical protein